MKTLGIKWLRILKISHLLFATMWIGGVMALVSLQLGLTPQTKEMMYMAAQAHLIVDEYFLIPGGIGILATALLYGTLTKWGFFKQRWLAVKWILTILLVVLGAGYMGATIKENLAYAQKILMNNADASIFLVNVRSVAIAGIVQLIGFVYIIIISVVKPWKKKNVFTNTVHGYE